MMSIDWGDKKGNVSEGYYPAETTVGNQAWREASVFSPEGRSPSWEKSEAIAQELHERIAKKAYELYESRGGSHGHDLDDWLEAERMVLAEQGPSGSGKAKKPQSRRRARKKAK